MAKNVGQRVRSDNCPTAPPAAKGRKQHENYGPNHDGWYWFKHSGTHHVADDVDGASESSVVLKHRRPTGPGPQRGPIRRQVETVQGRAEKEMGKLHGRRSSVYRGKPRQAGWKNSGALWGSKRRSKEMGR